MNELIKGSPHKRICSFAVLAKKDPLKTPLKSQIDDTKQSHIHGRALIYTPPYDTNSWTCVCQLGFLSPFHHLEYRVTSTVLPGRKRTIKQVPPKRKKRVSADNTTTLSSPHIFPWSCRSKKGIPKYSWVYSSWHLSGW